MGPLRWGICSAGKISHDFLVGLKTLPKSEHQVYAVAARSKDAAERFAQTHSIPQYYDSYAEIAANPEVDIVYVGTIHPKHYEVVMMMLEAGKPVLCEKPLTLNAADTRKLIQTARDKGVFFMEAVWMRFFPAMVELRKQLAEGVLGEVKHVHVTFGLRWATIPDRLAKPDLGGGAVLDLGVYTINLATMVFNEKPVKIISSGTLLDTGVDETVSIILRFSGGRMAQLTCSCNLELPKEAVISGTKGSIKVHSPFWCPIQLDTPKGPMDFPLPTPYLPTNFDHSEGMCYEAEEVRRCLSSNMKESDIMPLKDTQLVADVMDEVIQQVQKENKS